MSAAIIILVIALILLLIAGGIGIYFAFFRKTKAPTDSGNGNDPNPFQPITPIDPNPFQPITPVDPNNPTPTPTPGPTGATGPNSPTGTCAATISAALAANDFTGRRNALGTFNCTGNLLLWEQSNAFIYGYLSPGLGRTPADLLANYDLLMNDFYPNGITNNPQAYSDSLWAIRAIPTNQAQLVQFNRFWNQPVPRGLIPTSPKPANYPSALPVTNAPPAPIIPTPSPACTNAINAALAAPTIGDRVTQTRIKNCTGKLLLWQNSNLVAYFFIIVNSINSTVTPTDLLNNYNIIFNQLYPGGITNNAQAYSDSLWAIRAIPTNAAQLVQFNAFWNQTVPQGLIPTLPKPADYPNAV